jgi:hypothetical protein
VCGLEKLEHSIGEVCAKDQGQFQAGSLERESVLFIGTQFSILYTSMYSPAEAATLSKRSLHDLRKFQVARSTAFLLSKVLHELSHTHPPYTTML